MDNRLSQERINKAREAKLTDDQIVDSIVRNDPEFGERIYKARESGINNSTILKSIEKRLNNSEIPNSSNIPESPDSSYSFFSPETDKSLTESFNQIGESYRKGLNQSTSGLLAGNKPEINTKDPGFWLSLVEQAGTLTGDSPYIAAGATLGGVLGLEAGPIGAAVGGGFGSMALPAFLKESIRQYHEHVDSGENLSFGEFLQRSDKVANSTLKEGAFGVILGNINKVMPELLKIPGLDKLFKYTPVRKAAEIGIEATTLATAPALSEGRLPTSRDFGNAMALVLGVKATNLPASIRNLVEYDAAFTESVQRIAKAEGLSHEQVLSKLWDATKNYAKQKLGRPIKGEILKEDVEILKEQAKQNESEVTFETAKGSTYEVNENGTTTRTKKYRTEHGEFEQGLMKPSDKTWYVSEQDAIKLGEVQTSGDKKKLVELPDGRVGMMYTEGPNKGKVESRTVITPKEYPEEGLTPVEIWDDGSVHFGNKITKVNNKIPSEEVKTTKQELKEREKEILSAEEENIQKRIDKLEAQAAKGESEGKKNYVRLVKGNIAKQKKALEEAKAVREKSIPQTPEEVITKEPMLQIEYKGQEENPNVIKSIEQSPEETLSEGVFYPGFGAVTNTIQSVRSGLRNAGRRIGNALGVQTLVNDPTSGISKKGWRIVEDYMSTQMGLKERFFTRWNDAISKNKNITKQDREDMIFYRERTGNPFVDGDTFKALEARMSADSKKVVDTVVDDHMKESLELMNSSPFMQAKGVNPRQIVEDIYIRHFYSGKISRQKINDIFDSMQKRFGTDNPFRNKRTFLTFEEALQKAGLVPKYRDIVQNLAAQDGILTRVLSNNELIKNLHEFEDSIGIKLIARSSNKSAYRLAKQDGWVPFQDPYMRTHVAGVDKSGNNVWAITEAPALVHPDLASSLQGVFQKDVYKPDNVALRLYDRFNSTMNKLHVAASLFHFNALSESFVPGGGFVTSLIMSPKWWRQGTKMLDNSVGVEDAVRNGLKLNRHTDIDLQNVDTFYHRLMTKMQLSGNLPTRIIGKIGEMSNVFSRIHKFLFAEFQPRMKIITYENYVDRMLSYYEKKGMHPNAELLREIKRQSASAVNDQFGGQVMELIPLLNNKSKGMHRLLSFPDWTLSAIREVSQAVSSVNPIRRKLGQRYLVEYMIGLTIGTQLLSYGLTGITNKPNGSVTWDVSKAHSTFENQDPKRRNMFDVEMPDFYIEINGDQISMGRDEKGRKYFMHGGKKVREIYRYFHSPISALFAKSTSLIQNATKFAIDYTPSEEGIFPVRGAYVEGEFRPWDGTKKGTIARATSYAKEIASSTLPYSLQTIISDAFDSQEDFLQALSRTGFKFIQSGGGSLSVGKGLSLRSSEPYWEEAYQIKDEIKRENSLRALRLVLRDYGYKDKQIKRIESKIKRRVNSQAERR